MKYPTKELFGKTWVGWLNFLLLQWLFIRLQGHAESDMTLIAWEIRIAVPLTGWWNGYWPQKVHFKLYKFKKVNL